jgi:hypothetical protein
MSQLHDTGGRDRGGTAARGGADQRATDAPIPLSRFRAAAARPHDRRRLDALLEAENPAAAVAELSVQEVFTIISSVGLADCQELCALLTPEQFQGCLDLDIWESDRIDTDRLVPWLEALLASGPEHFGAVWSQLDSELAALTLQQLAEIFDRSMEEAPPEEDERPLLHTPDTFFTLAIRSERQEDVALVHRLVDSLYTHDDQLARHTLMAARSEPTAALEEMSYRWHGNRLADLGYVDFYEALEVFRPLEVAQVRIGEGTADRLATCDRELRQVLPAPVAQKLSGRRFLAAALDRIQEASEAERLEVALLVLVNRVLSASRARPGDEAAVRAGAELALCTLSLGLETLSGGDLPRAEAALRSVSLTRLHRVGHTAILRLGRVARSLAPVARMAADVDRTLVDALGRPRPWFPELLDRPDGTGFRPFESVADLRTAAAALTRLTLRIAVVQSLGVDLVALGAAPEPRPELDEHVRTALARVLGGGPLSAAPLRRAELSALRQRAFTGALLPAEARAAARGALVDHLERSRVDHDPQVLNELLAGWLDDLEQTFASWPTGPDADLRFAGGVITVAE